MKIWGALLLVIACIGCSFCRPCFGQEQLFELIEGDRVVFLGDTFIEQEQYAGWIELMMTTAFPSRHVTFRNLGWSADTPAGNSRFGLSLLQAGREPDDEGWKQLLKQLELTDPTVVIFGYGMASSLEGGLGGVKAFKHEYERLLASITGICPDVRFVFLSPVSRTDQPSERSDAHRQALRAYSSVIASLAASRNCVFVDLSAVATHSKERKNPIHLNDNGYRAVAIEIGKKLGYSKVWQSNPNAELLRSVILQKNTWWFHRSRPANMAYVFGFRKREQGQNAIEIPKYDELIAEEEKNIALLRSLENNMFHPQPPQVESQYAKFHKQPTPQFTVGKDLEVTLWAENPQLNKPIQMNFDPSGRLWVASSEAYPMIEVGQSSPDKILILEDTNNDGRADSSTVFADGLLIPTGVEPGDGGCYVAQSTDLLFLKDTDGDGKADIRKRLLTGFGTEDTHHNLHTLRWGPDGRLYMNQSIYTRTDTETSRGVVRLKAGGGFRYHPSTMRMEVVFRGLVNSWGHQFDAYGQSFLTDGAGFSGIAYSFPGAVFAPVPGSRRTLGLISPGNYPKFASLEIVYGDSYPPEWQGSVITCDFRANRVTRFSMSEQGAGFVTKQEDDLLRTSASTFRPIDVKQGPDGALYIADWSNPIINHGEVDFRDERRDRWHGRIWRVTWKKGAKKKKEDLTKLENGELLRRLVSDDRYTRNQSRRVLVERGEETIDAVQAWTARAGDEYSRLQGVWLQHCLDQISFPQVSSLAAAKDPRIRAAAIRVVSDLVDPETDVSLPMSLAEAIGLFSKAVHDEHPRVRLEAIRGLGKLKTAEAGAVALQSLKHPRDRFIDFALATTMDELTDSLMAALEKGLWKPDSEGQEEQLDFFLGAIEPSRAAAFLSKELSHGPMPADGSGPWINLVRNAGGKPELTILLHQALSGGFEPSAVTKALNALLDAHRIRKEKPSGDLNAITSFLESPHEATRVATIQLIGSWKLDDHVQKLSELAVDGSSDRIREVAIESLRLIGAPAAEAIKQLVGVEDRMIRSRAIIAAATFDPHIAAKPLFKTLSQCKTDQQAIALWRGALSTKNAGKVFAKLFPSDGVSELAARTGLMVAKEGGRNESALIAVLTPFANRSMKAPALTPERTAELIRLVRDEGNPGRGESIYRREDLQCMKCHAIGGVGGKVGPDMTSLGTSAPIDYLIESIFKPNAKIKENYHSVNILTTDGLVVAGIVVQSTDGELVLRDANNKIIRVSQDDIELQKPGKSLMPDGLVERLTQQEQVDLISFLTQLGRPGNYDASQGGVARVYDVLAGTHRIEQGGVNKIVSGQLSDGWMPFISRVNGTVFGSQLAAMTKQPHNISLVHVYLRTRVSVEKDEEVTFSTAGAEKSALWVDGKAVDGDHHFTTQLSRGSHTVLVRLDARDLPTAFRLVSRDVTFATN